MIYVCQFLVHSNYIKDKRLKLTKYMTKILKDHDITQLKIPITSYNLVYNCIIKNISKEGFDISLLQETFTW